MVPAALLRRFSRARGWSDNFYTGFLSLVCANIQAEKRWWIAVFDFKETKVPQDWDDPLPFDTALKLAGNDNPTILIRDKTECQQA
jgi:hypothetical protein